MWTSVERVAPNIDRWRYQETLGYVKKIESNKDKLTTSDVRWRSAALSRHDSVTK